MWCDDCQGSGERDCYCGGDQCICDRCGSYPCPVCKGRPVDDDDDDWGPDDDGE